MQANSVQKGGAEEEAARLLAAARQEIKQLRSQLVLMRGGGFPPESAHGACDLRNTVRHRSKAAGLDEVLSVPIICLLQALCLLGLFAVHAWPNML